MHPTWTETVIFRAGEEVPLAVGGKRELPALILNPCDGYHHVFARWWEDGEFRGFFDFLGTSEYGTDCYVAWALLPEELPLVVHFDQK